MAIDYNKALALELRTGISVRAARVASLRSIGAPPGVMILFVAGRNGPGMGHLRTTADGSSLQWKAPSSTAFGPSIDCPSDNSYTLEDGDDPDKAIIVQVYADYLEGGVEASVLLTDVYGNEISHDDVTAGEAAAGDVTSYTIIMRNVSAGDITWLTVWLDADTPNLEISEDYATWVSPTTEAGGLVFPTLAVSTYDVLYVRRTISASSNSDPSVLVQLHVSFWLNAGEALSSKRYADARGKYRIFNAAEYRFYRDNSAPPEEGDTPFDTNATLPHTPTNTYANGTWYISMSRFNGVLDSGFLPVGPNGETYLRLDLAAGAEEGSPPNAPLGWRLELRPNGVVRVIGTYYQVGDLRATQWAIAYTTDESSPPADTPDETETMPTRGLAQLVYDLPAQGDETIVKVRLQTRRQDGETWVYSEGSTVLTVTADAQGPSAPLAAERYPGRLPESL